MSDNEQWWQTDENDQVATAPKLWRPLAEAIGGFDLDPAAGCEPTAIAEDRYTPEDNGLRQPWYGTVWLNPPFSDKPPWYRKLVSEYRCGDVTNAVAVGTGDISTSWYQQWFATADLFCHLEGRDWYIHGDNTPSFATQIGVWNPNDEIISTLRAMGRVVEPLKSDAQRQQSTLPEVGVDAHR